MCGVCVGDGGGGGRRMRRGRREGQDEDRTFRLQYLYIFLGTFCEQKRYLVLILAQFC